MNITINGSNSLENLARELSLELKRQQNHVFQPQYIITQTEGMNNWLKIKIAEHLGIVANCRFLKPNDLINDIYYKLGAAGRQALSAGELQWVIFSLLATAEFKSGFSAIAQYFEADDVKRMALAEKTADLFDQYQIYRPDMISSWNENDGGFEEKSGWQKYLWVKVKKVLGDRMPDKTIIGKHIVEALRQPEQQQRLATLMPNLHLFGLSIITSYHVQLFYELSRFIDISVHLLNPAPSVYWQEDKSEKQLSLWRQSSSKRLTLLHLQHAGNTLLSNWGGVLQDTFRLFFESDDVIDRYNEVLPVEPRTNTLLGKIQNDIFNNHDADARNPVMPQDLSDGSLTINACYTIAREIEVLYNYLVHLIDGNKAMLAPRDIVVMVSDIDSYAPYIKAVFNAAPFRFPFTVADESFAISDNLFSALHSVFSLTEENFKAETVLQLLESGLIKKRFGITDLYAIRKAVDAANIRFGIDGRKEDDTVFVSWKNGIKRIMFGICMRCDGEYLLGDTPLYPVDKAEGFEAFELIRFCHFAEVLISTIEERKQARSVSDWGEYLEQVAAKLICQPDDGADDDYQLLMRSLERLYLLSDIVNDRISFEVFRHSFVDPLSADSRSSVFASGGITFCSLIPMRSIPFRVVALLGMDFDKFPRKETRNSFNIMEQDKRRRGDRNVKENDKHLFLETILSAQEYLYISYLGRSSKDNSPKPASVLVDELVEYIQSGLKAQHIIVKEKLITTHPLHGFSPKYNRNTPGLYNYLGTEASADLSQTQPAGLQHQSEQPVLNFGEVSTERFTRFFKNPVRAYFKEVLSIRYDEDDVLLPETELFGMDQLQTWKLKQDLLLTKTDEMAAYRQKGIATGTLPLKHMADHVLSSVETEMNTAKKIIKEVIGETTEQVCDIDLDIAGTSLKGQVSGIYQDKLVHISFSKNEAKYLVDGCLKYLLLVAAGRSVDLVFISRKKSLHWFGKKEFDRKQAVAKLESLMKMYKQGHESMLVFFPFEKSPSAIRSLTRDHFRKMVYDDQKAGKMDIYLEKAYLLGLFDEPDIHEEYIRNCNLIFSGQEHFHENFFTKPGGKS